jgi:hypothetical protein
VSGTITGIGTDSGIAMTGASGTSTSLGTSASSPRNRRMINA